MKKALAFVLVFGVGFGSAYWWLGSSRGSGGASGHADGDSSGQDDTGLKFTPSNPRSELRPQVRVVTNTVYATGTNQLSAEEVLAVLLKLNPDTGEQSRNRVFRQIIFHLQTLAYMGESALPVIHEFLRKNQDVDYSRDLVNVSGERINSSGGTTFASRSVIRTDFVVPPTLRLGLVDVLEQIGSPAAIQALAEMLDTTGRGVEVAYVARVLQDIAPNQYRDNALKAAKDLLANPPKIDRPTRLDDNSRAYLYSVLAMYRDTSFAETAQGLLITPDGRVDRQAMSFLTGTLREQAAPALYSAYKNERLTNQTERAHVLAALLNFTGPSAQANEVFKEIVSDISMPAAIRGYTILSMAGGHGRDKPTDPKVIEARLDFLRTLRDSFKDERIILSIDETRATLEKLKSKPLLE